VLWITSGSRVLLDLTMLTLLAHSPTHRAAPVSCRLEFSDEPMRVESVPTLRDGQVLQLYKGSLLDCDTGGWLWPAALVLCRWLATADGIQGSRVLELGCGTGAVGLYAAALGASEVMMTDVVPAVLALATANVELNRALWTESTHVEAAALPWGESSELGSFDWVVGSDLVYAAGAEQQLCWTLAEQLRLSEDCRIVIAQERRPLRDQRAGGTKNPDLDTTLDAFLAEATSAGLEARQIGEEGLVSVVEIKRGEGWAS
jgi:2-polyprenyl-3-methyl-5-hydroxy-6-metoxy-1,4-benzoquinol methylase